MSVAKIIWHQWRTEKWMNEYNVPLLSSSLHTTHQWGAARKTHRSSLSLHCAICRVHELVPSLDCSVSAYSISGLCYMKNASVNSVSWLCYIQNASSSFISGLHYAYKTLASSTSGLLCMQNTSVCSMSGLHYMQNTSVCSITGLF